jgi:hypothetical protein
MRGRRGRPHSWMTAGPEPCSSLYRQRSAGQTLPSNLTFCLQRRAAALAGHGISDAASSSLDLARFGALHEPRIRLAHPCSRLRQWPPVVLTSTYISSDLSQSAQYTFSHRWRHQSVEPVPPGRRDGLLRPAMVCTLAARSSCVQRKHISLPSMTHALSDREPCHASLDLVLGTLSQFTAHRHTQADMSLYAGRLVKQTANPTDPVLE